MLNAKAQRPEVQVLEHSLKRICVVGLLLWTATESYTGLPMSLSGWAALLG
jgi:hypothetical protein